MEKDVLIVTIQSITAILVATIGILPLILSKKSPDKKKIIPGNNIKKETKNISSHANKKIIYGIIAGVITVFSFYLSGYAVKTFIFKPIIEVEYPYNNQKIDLLKTTAGSGEFWAHGKVKNFDKNFKLYILVYPVDPYGDGWWIQPEIYIQDDGTWEGKAWIGSDKYPPSEGTIFNIAVVLVDKNRNKLSGKIDNPRDITPVTITNVVGLEVEKIK
ncbi:membrane protein [Candidatus Omnitrophus magneticus]|uniref:Membrane protein n=1 Tax=Candidatus Omnitrophus magneticus TaxID=1609969 RepID=A0A0F0CSQ7_9BACT|nr:membrane protein [Candidatus Omnitrophus magneticus]